MPFKRIRNAYDPIEIEKARTITILKRYAEELGVAEKDGNLEIAIRTVDDYFDNFSSSN